MRRDTYRVPEQDGEVLVVPALPELPDHLEGNRALLAAADLTVNGQSFQELRRETREALWEIAFSRPGSARGVSPDRPLIVTGHQPEFFHPGIWLKNHLASWLARGAGGIGANFVVDSDAPGARSISFPQVTGADVRKRELVFLADRPGLANEEFRIGDGVDFAGVQAAAEEEALGERMRESLQRFLDRLEMEPGQDLPTTVSRLRLAYEAEHGLENLELMLSRLSETRPFRHFLLHILANLDAWREAYNGSLDEYRRLHGIRSRANPLPDLQVNETPFWIWPAGRERRSLFVDLSGGSARLLYEGESVGEVPLGSAAGQENALEALAEISRSGVRVRPRALVTTMFARLFFADIFIHGIGGAKYDVVTDEIIQRFFRLEPPVYIAASGTFHLPVEAVIAGGDSPDRLQYQARDVDYNPFRYAPESRRRDPQFIERHTEKQLLLNLMPDREKARKYELFLRIKELNREMASSISSEAKVIRERLAAARSLTRQKAILEARGYPFFLFPESGIREVLSRAGIGS